MGVASTASRIGFNFDWEVTRQPANCLIQPEELLCKRLGIMLGGMHAFRHGRTSHLQANNVPTDFTKSQVGHSSLRTTSGYTHFGEDFARQTVERLASEMPSGTHSGKLHSVETAAH
jgi:integrase